MDDPNSLLWHYTTFNGLQGIVTGNVWASSLAYLNDTTEYRYALEMALQALEAPSQSDHRGRFSLTYSSVPKMLQHYFGRVQGDSIFVACFSRAFDDLNQWRAYTGNPGFAIGLDGEELASAAGSSFELRECCYDAREQRKGLDDKLKELTGLMELEEADLGAGVASTNAGIFEGERSSFIERWSYEIFRCVDALAASYKHPKFAAEQEVRLVGKRPGTLGGRNQPWSEHYRVSGSLLVPYVSINIGLSRELSPIKLIAIGPGPHPRAVADATRQMLRSHGISAEVIVSEVPFRNW